MITVHHLNNSRSQRVLWLLEELGVPYEIQKYQRDPQTMLAPAELTASLGGRRRFTRIEYDVVAQALNERFMDDGGDHPVPYADEAAGR